MNETIQEFHERWSPAVEQRLASGAGGIGMPFVFLCQAWPVIKAEVERQKAEAERTPEPVICVRCHKPIGCESDMYYLGGEGLTHVACVPLAEGTPPVSLDVPVICVDALIRERDEALAETQTLTEGYCDIERERDEALDALAAIIAQFCALSDGSGKLDSALLYNSADAMRLLARAGRLVIVSGDGKNHVVGRWAAKAEKKGAEADA